MSRSLISIAHTCVAACHEGVVRADGSTDNEREMRDIEIVMSGILSSP